MSKILDWIKAHKVATIFIILGAFFLPLIIVTSFINGIQMFGFSPLLGVQET